MPEPVPKFRAKVIKGLYNVNVSAIDKDRFETYLKTMPADVEMVVRPFKLVSNRSIKQNNYYFGTIVSMVAEDLGYEEEDAHEWIKVMFNHKFVTYMDDGEEKTVCIPKSTTKLSTVEFSDMIKRIRDWFSKERFCYIPEPDEVDDETQQEEIE
jgi:hypothetical protein